MSLISMELAHRIWLAHREIAVGTKLRDELLSKIDSGEDPTPIDEFGRRRNFQLGVPSGDHGHRLLNVEPALAVEIIDAHVAAQRSELAAACAEARTILNNGR